MLLQFLNITAYALDGFAFAAEALVGQAIGGRNVQALRQSVVLSSLWGLVITASLAVLFAGIGAPLIDFMAKAPDVQIEARQYLPYMVAAPLVGVAAWMLDGVFIGATQSRDMRNMMAISLGVYVLAAASLLPLLGNHGLWLALLVSFIARGVTLGLKYPSLERKASVST